MSAVASANASINTFEDQIVAASASLSPSLYTSQNLLLMKNLMAYYENTEHLDRMLRIINGDANISLRTVDWFITNYAKKYYTVYDLPDGKRFKVYIDYKLHLRSYTKKRFDCFCRWERINVPYKDNTCIQTTIGQLNFFKWAFTNRVIDYIEANYVAIEKDMNNRNSTSKRKLTLPVNGTTTSGKTRKKREELSISATKSIKKEDVQIVVTFN
jgi:hypothetical protein